MTPDRVAEALGRPTFWLGDGDFRWSWHEGGIVPDKIDIVNVFRRSERVPLVVEEAAARARAAGLAVVMDRCLMKEHRRLLG